MTVSYHITPHITLHILLSHNLLCDKPKYSGSYSLVIKNFFMQQLLTKSFLLIAGNSYSLWFGQGNGFTYYLVNSYSLRIQRYLLIFSTLVTTHKPAIHFL